MQVAIKIVSKASVADVGDIERVYRETFILTTLKHTNIIKLYEVCEACIVFSCLTIRLISARIFTAPSVPFP